MDLAGSAAIPVVFAAADFPEVAVASAVVVPLAEPVMQNREKPMSRVIRLMGFYYRSSASCTGVEPSTGTPV